MGLYTFHQKKNDAVEDEEGRTKRRGKNTRSGKNKRKEDEWEEKGKRLQGVKPNHCS